jgi:hypothetical protein
MLAVHIILVVAAAVVRIMVVDPQHLVVLVDWAAAVQVLMQPEQQVQQTPEVAVVVANVQVV